MLFKAPHPILPLYYYRFFYIVLSLVTVLLVHCDRYWDRVSLAGAGLVARLQVGQALVCSGCFGFGQQFQSPMFLGTHM